jgi:uncharacterized protein (TIGR02118 family)
MTNTPVINIVGTFCRPEYEEKFNKWYSEIHIPMLMKFKGIKEVTRYKYFGTSKDYPAYIAIYYFDSKADLEAYNKSPELATARDEMKQSWPDSSCWEVNWRAPYEFMKDFRQE